MYVRRAKPGCLNNPDSLAPLGCRTCASHRDRCCWPRGYFTIADARAIDYADAVLNADNQTLSKTDAHAVLCDTGSSQSCPNGFADQNTAAPKDPYAANCRPFTYSYRPIASYCSAKWQSIPVDAQRSACVRHWDEL